MKSINKLLIIVLSVSNFFVIALVAGLFLSKDNPNAYYSMSASNELTEAVNKKCKKEIQDVADNKRREYVCTVKVQKREGKARYTVKIKAIIKNKNGNIEIAAEGKISDKNQATEAGFCSDCREVSRMFPLESTSVLKEFMDIASRLEYKAERNAIEAAKKHQEKATDRAAGLKQEKQCLGTWNELEEKLEKFSIDEQVDCKMSKVKKQVNMYEAENYYNKSGLKSDLWSIALSDDYLLTDNYLDSLKKTPLRNSLSVKHSVNFMKKYLFHRDSYEDGDFLDEEFTTLIGKLKGEATSLNVNGIFNTDIQFLQQAESGVTNASPLTLPTSTPGINTAPAAPNVSTPPNKKDLNYLYDL